MNSHQIIFIQFSNNEGSKSQQFLGGGWRHLNDHVWKRSPGHDTNDVIMGGFDAHSSTYLVVGRNGGLGSALRLPVPPFIMVSTLLSLSLFLSHFKNHKNCSCCDHLTRFLLLKIVSFQVVVLQTFIVPKIHSPYNLVKPKYSVTSQFMFFGTRNFP